MPIFFGDRPDGGPVFPASGQSTPPPPPAPSTSGVGGSSGGDGGSAPPPSSRSQPAKQHPVQPRPAQAPPLNIPGSYHPGRVQPATRAHPTRALANVMHQGGGITAAASGASTTPRTKTQANPTRALAVQSLRTDRSTRRANPSDAWLGGDSPRTGGALQIHNQSGDGGSRPAGRERRLQGMRHVSVDPYGPGGLAEQLNEIFDPTLAKGAPGESDVVRRYFNALVERHWSAPVDPTFAQTGEFYRLWRSNPHDPAMVLLRRGWAIQKDLESAQGAYRQRLLGAISSLSVVLAIQTNFDDVGLFGAEGGTVR